MASKFSPGVACPCPRGFSLNYATNDQSFCLVWLLFNVPVNKFSVMLGQSHCFLGIYQYFLLLTSSFFYYLSKSILIQNIFNTLDCKRRPLVNLLFSSSKLKDAYQYLPELKARAYSMDSVQTSANVPYFVYFFRRQFSTLKAIFIFV